MIHIKRKTFSKGNAVVEYILITALTALATIAIFKTFRADVSQAYKKAGETLINGVASDTTSEIPAP